MTSVFLWSFAPLDIAVKAISETFLAVFLGTLILEVLMPNYFLSRFYVYTPSCFNNVLKPEDSCPWGSQKLSRDTTAESILEKSISTSLASFCCFSKIAFPEDRLHQFSFPTFPIKLPSTPFVRGPASHLRESFKVPSQGIETVGELNKWTI